jgi:iron complex transport system substrate-binding protein
LVFTGFGTAGLTTEGTEEHGGNNGTPPCSTVSSVVNTLRFCALLLLTGACAADQQRSRDAAGVSPFGVDDFGDTVRLSGRAERIVSLTPATTEILFALGAGARLVGRGDYDHWPDSALQVRSLGPGLRPNVEAILAVKPDLVLLYASQDNRAAAQRLRDAGITTAAFKVDRIEQFARTTRMLGRLIGDSARGALVADTVLRTLDSVRAVTRSLSPVSVVLPTWSKPLIVIGGGSFMSELVTIAGGRNVYDSVASPSPTVTLEDVVRRNPDAVLVGPEQAVVVRASNTWGAVAAVRRKRVLVFDTALVLRPAVRLGEGAVSLAKLLHPELAR